MLKSKIITGYCAGVIIGLLLGIILYYFQPTQWKGEALIRMGEFLQDHTPFEPVPVMTKRIQLKSFIEAVAKRAKRDDIISLLDPHKGNGLRVKTIKDTHSILITVVGNSADLVEAAITSIADEILLRHKQIQNAYESDIIEELSRLDIEIDTISKKMNDIMTDQDKIQGNTIDNRTLSNSFQMVITQNELNRKLNRSSLLRESIYSTNIRSTSLLEPVSIFKQRMFKSMWRTCLFGVLFSLIFCFLYYRRERR